jgi:hypothetical protein
MGRKRGRWRHGYRSWDWWWNHAIELRRQRHVADELTRETEDLGLYDSEAWWLMEDDP